MIISWNFEFFVRGSSGIFIKVLCSRLCLFYYGQYWKSLLYRRNCSKLKAKISISSIVIVGWVTVELLIENQWCCNMELVLIANSANRVSAIRNVERDEIRLKKDGDCLLNFFTCGRIEKRVTNVASLKWSKSRDRYWRTKLLWSFRLVNVLTFNELEIRSISLKQVNVKEKYKSSFGK